MKERTISVTQYEAFDGKMFESFEECLNYEETLKDNTKKTLEEKGVRAYDREGSEYNLAFKDVFKYALAIYIPDESILEEINALIKTGFYKKPLNKLKIGLNFQYEFNDDLCDEYTFDEMIDVIDNTISDLNDELKDYYSLREAVYKISENHKDEE